MGRVLVAQIVGLGPSQTEGVAVDAVDPNERGRGKQPAGGRPELRKLHVGHRREPITTRDGAGDGAPGRG
jgi:hypothetical protein